MKKLSLVLAVACLAVAGCDTKETRSGSITLSSAANIPLIDKSGTHAELVAGASEITFQKGSKDGTVAIRVRQPNRPEVNIEAPIAKNGLDGNFTLRGSEIGQPVDLVSARGFTITGPNERYSRWEDRGMETCLVETSWDPCDESWTVSFRTAAGELGAFAARTFTHCNERRNEFACHPLPGREPRIPDFPRGPQHRFNPQAINPETLKFD